MSGPARGRLAGEPHVHAAISHIMDAKAAAREGYAKIAIASARAAMSSLTDFLAEICNDAPDGRHVWLLDGAHWLCTACGQQREDTTWATS